MKGQEHTPKDSIKPCPAFQVLFENKGENFKLFFRIINQIQYRKVCVCNVTKFEKVRAQRILQANKKFQ